MQTSSCSQPEEWFGKRVLTLRNALIWAALAAATGIPLVAAAFSPQLAWRDPVYITAGFAGIAAMALMLLQPLLVGGYLPGVTRMRARRVHRAVGASLVLAIVVHVGALWITSPPDVIDALVLASPTSFSIWGVIAMWSVFAAAFVAALRKSFAPRIWRKVHSALAVLIVAGTVLHALLIDGTMEQVSKVALSVLLVAATVKAMADLRVWAIRKRARSGRTPSNQ